MQHQDRAHRATTAAAVKVATTVAVKEVETVAVVELVATVAVRAVTMLAAATPAKLPVTLVVTTGLKCHRRLATKWGSVLRLELLLLLLASRHPPLPRALLPRALLQEATRCVA